MLIRVCAINKNFSINKETETVTEREREGPATRERHGQDGDKREREKEVPGRGTVNEQYFGARGSCRAGGRGRRLEEPRSTAAVAS